MRIQIYTKEATNEKPHVHVINGRGKGSASFKVWLDNTSKVHDLVGEFPGTKMTIALNTIEASKEALVKEYYRIHGAPMPRKSKKK